MCSGGPPKPPKPPPPPQIAKAPNAIAVRKEIEDYNSGKSGGIPMTTLLTGGSGDQIANNLLGKKTLLGE